MKKLFKKKQFILSVLVLMLAAAIYVNWQFSDGAVNKPVTSQPDSNLGEAEFVGNSNVDISNESNSYFTDARKDREEAREDAIEQLDEIQNSPKIDDAEKSAAINEKIRIAADIETEANIESLVKAKGFKDCIAIVNNDSVNIVVRSDTLENSEILQIQDIVISQIKVELDDIKIINVE